MRNRTSGWTAWGCINKSLNDAFIEVFPDKKRMIDYAVQRNIGAGEYIRAGNNSKRWKIAYSRGWRLVRVHVRPETTV